MLAGSRTLWRVLLALVALATCTASVAAGAARPRLLWIVQPTGELVAHALPGCTAVGGVPLPEFAFRDPSCLSVNGRGEVLARAGADSIWVWDGRRWLAGRRAPHERYLRPRPGITGTCNRSWYLGAEGGTLYLLETSSVTWSDGNRDSAWNASRMLALDFGLRDRGLVFELPFVRCEDDPPGDLVAGTEPCPEVEIQVTDGVVPDWFIRRAWTGDELETDDATARAKVEQALFVRNGTRWRRAGDAPWCDWVADRGRTWIDVDTDDGCCGWSNESSESAVLHDLERGARFFSEWAECSNEQYDVSFRVERARPSPARTHVAYTLTSDGRAVEPLRLSAEGHVDSTAAASLRAHLSEVPVVEVKRLWTRPARVLRVPHAEFVGWLDERRIVLLQARRIAIVDILSGRRTDTGLNVRHLRDVFLPEP